MIKEIFPIKIYEVDFPNYFEIQESVLNDVKTFFEDREQFANHRLFRNAYSIEGTKDFETRDLHKKLKNQEVIQFIEKHIKIYWKELGYTELYEPGIIHMWSNLTPHNGNIIHHNHSPFEIAGSFYVEADSDMGCLALVDPNENIKGRLPYYTNGESKQGRYFFDHLVEPRPGKLVLFPGWLYHKTQVNLSNKERYVLGLNSGLFFNTGDGKLA